MRLTLSLLLGLDIRYGPTARI